MQTLTQADFLCMIDKLLTAAPGSLNGSERLDELPAWDSLAAIGFIAMLDDKLGITLSPGKIEHCKTVGDLLALAGDRVNAEETVQ